MEKYNERERRRVKTTKERHGPDVFRNGGRTGGLNTWKNIRMKIKRGELNNPL